MNDRIRDFQTYLSTERNVSEHTRTAYIGDVEEFIEFLQNNNFIKNSDEILNVPTDTVRAYLGYLFRQKVKKNVKTGYIFSMQSAPIHPLFPSGSLTSRNAPSEQ